MHRGVLNNAKLRHILLRHIRFSELRVKGMAYFIYYIGNLRRYLPHKSDIPFFQSLLHNGVICIVEHLTRRLQREVKALAFKHHQPYKLRHGYHGMRIVELNRRKLCEIRISAAVNGSVLSYDILKRCA